MTMSLGTNILCNNFKGFPPPGDTTGFYFRLRLLLMDLVGDHIHTFNSMAKNKNHIHTHKHMDNVTTGNDISMETLDNPGPFPLILLWESYARENLAKEGNPTGANQYGSGAFAPVPTWSDYCEEIGVSKHTDNALYRIALIL